MRNRLVPDDRHVDASFVRIQKRVENLLVLLVHLLPAGEVLEDGPGSSILENDACIRWDRCYSSNR